MGACSSLPSDLEAGPSQWYEQELSWPGGGAVEKNFLAERVCLYSLLLCPQGSGKSSRPEKFYQIPFFTHPALNFMENKTEKKKKKKKQSNI